MLAIAAAFSGTFCATCLDMLAKINGYRVHFTAVLSGALDWISDVSGEVLRPKKRRVSQTTQRRVPRPNRLAVFVQEALHLKHRPRREGTLADPTGKSSQAAGEEARSTAPRGARRKARSPRAGWMDLAQVKVSGFFARLLKVLRLERLAPRRRIRRSAMHAPEDLQGQGAAIDADDPFIDEPDNPVTSRGLLQRISWGIILPMKAFLQARRTILSLVGIIVLVLLMMNLNTRLSDYFHLSSQRDALGTEVSSLELTRIALRTQVAYATSDQAVEDWARNEAHMAKPGDVVIVQVTPVGQPVKPVASVTPATRVIENWEVWWALFFGE